jgi:hypothetical protein
MAVGFNGIYAREGVKLMFSRVSRQVDCKGIQSLVQRTGHRAAPTQMNRGEWVEDVGAQEVINFS